MPAGTIYEIRTVCSITNQQSLNVSHWYVDTSTFTVLNTEMRTIVDGHTAGVAPLYKAVLANGASFYGCGIARVNPKPRTITIGNNLLNGFGTGGADIMPAQVSGLIKLKTDFAGKGYRGRIYIPFPSRAASDPNGACTTAYFNSLIPITSWYTVFHSYSSAGQNAVVLPVILHRRKDKLPAPPGSYDLITGGATVGIFATQRSRGGFGRPNIALPF